MMNFPCWNKTQPFDYFPKFAELTALHWLVPAARARYSNGDTGLLIPALLQIRILIQTWRNCRPLRLQPIYTILRARGGALVFFNVFLDCLGHCTITVRLLLVCSSCCSSLLLGCKSIGTIFPFSTLRTFRMCISTNFQFV